MSATGIVTVAPAATARATAASTSSDAKWIVTGEPFKALGPRAPHSGISSTSIRVESPMRSAACISLPLGAGTRIVSIAPKARS